MKNLALLATSIFLTFSAFAQKVNSEPINYTDSVEFVVVRFTNAKTSDGGNTIYIAEKGTAYKSVWFDFTNKSDKDEIINFGDIYLLDSKDNKYRPRTVVQTMKMSTGNNQELEITLKAGKEKRFLVEFWPPFPKDDHPRLALDHRIIDLPNPSK